MHVCLTITAVMATIKVANAYLPSHHGQHQSCKCMSVQPSWPTSKLTVWTLPHRHQHSLLCIHGLKCCCIACRCMLDMYGAASVMPRGITLKGMQSAVALGGSSNQTAVKKTSPAGSMCQYVPEHQQPKSITPC